MATTVGFIIVQPGNIYQASRVSTYGGGTAMFTSFADAKAWVNAAVAGKIKLRDTTRAGAQGGHGGPTTYTVEV